MKIFPAIDLYDSKAVRLYKGDYNQMTVYSDEPLSVARDFKAQGAEFIHLVDLEGAKEGSTKNLGVIERIVSSTDLFAEVGGGIRTLDTIEKYISVGVGRVILGTAAVENRAFLEEALSRYGEKIAVGVDIKDGFVAVSGWRERTAVEAMSFCRELDTLGVKTLISTDISRDGAMQGANHSLYERLSSEVGMNIIASGGVSDISDVERLAKMKLYGAIIGKAYYTGAISLRKAIEVANDN